MSGGDWGIGVSLEWGRVFEGNRKVRVFDWDMGDVERLKRKEKCLN